MLKRFLIFLSIFCCVLSAPLFLLSQNSLRAVFQFFASDTYYYLTVATHSIGKLFFTSDGLYPTNGFHPLWQWILGATFSIPVIQQNQDLQLLLVYGAGALLVSFGVGLMGLSVYQLTGSYAITLLSCVPGFYYLIFSIVSPSYNSVWSFINGMETPLSVFLFGLFLYLAINKKLLLSRSIPVVVLISALLTLMVLARLDDIFIFVPFFILLMLGSKSVKAAMAPLAAACLLPGMGIGAYMLTNQLYAGSMVPISGALKGGFHFLESLLSFVVSVLPTPAAYARLSFPWSELTMRGLQELVPVLVAAAFTWHWVKNRAGLSWGAYVSRDYERGFLGIFGLYVILKGLYNIFFAALLAQGHWYYPASIMFANLIAAKVISDLIKDKLPSKRLLINLAALSLVLLNANSFASSKVWNNYNAIYYTFWSHRQALEKTLLSRQPDLKILEVDDGEISYGLNIPTMNGTGFVLDKPAVLAKMNGRLLPVAYERGFRTIGVLNPGYIALSEEAKDNPEALKEVIQGITTFNLEDLSPWKFSLLYQDPATGAVFVNFEPAD